MKLHFVLATLVALLAGCATQAPAPSAAPPVAATPAQVSAAARVGLSAERLTTLLNKPIYKMQPAEVGDFIAFEQAAEPSLRARIATIARKNIGQPYELFLLGEFPYETYDAQPLFDLTKSDCVVFVEHTYAMAMSGSWEEFFWMLQRIRYRDGVIGAATRNHYTETDWNIANRWLVSDISAELAGDKAATYQMRIDRTAFLKKQFKIDRDIPVQDWTETFVPKDAVAAIEPRLQEGDFVNIISGSKGNFWASHVGLIVLGADGTRHLIHSAEPQVREETLQGFIQRMTERDARNAAAGKTAAAFQGFKFLRLNDAPQAPPMAPQPRPAARKIAS